jgi:hypothetical protein
MESYCVRGFAESLEVVPYTLAENAGLNPIQIVTELRNLHAQDNGAGAYYGINVKKVGVQQSGGLCCVCCPYGLRPLCCFCRQGAARAKAQPVGSRVWGLG